MKRQRTDWIPGHTTTYLDQGPCPVCGIPLKLVTDVKKGCLDDPAPGAYCICTNCHAMNVLDDNLKLKRPNPAEIAIGVATDPDFNRAYTISMRDHVKWKARN